MAEWWYWVILHFIIGAILVIITLADDRYETSPRETVAFFFWLLTL
jgi:uncharacterized membrane protein YhaH (DUF805 family)